MKKTENISLAGVFLGLLLLLAGFASLLSRVPSDINIVNIFAKL